MFYPIKLDKMRNLRYGMKAMALIEQELDTSISKLDTGNMTIRETAVFLWAGLYHEDNTLTPDIVMDLVDDYSDLKTVFAAMGAAVNGSFKGVGAGSQGEKNQKKE